MCRRPRRRWEKRAKNMGYAVALFLHTTSEAPCARLSSFWLCSPSLGAVASIRSPIRRQVRTTAVRPPAPARRVATAAPLPAPWVPRARVRGPAKAAVPSGARVAPVSAAPARVAALGAEAPAAQAAPVVAVVPVAPVAVATWGAGAVPGAPTAADG
jgi:hypothetical protein